MKPHPREMISGGGQQGGSTVVLKIVAGGGGVGRGMPQPQEYEKGVRCSMVTVLRFREAFHWPKGELTSCRCWMGCSAISELESSLLQVDWGQGMGHWCGLNPGERGACRHQDILPSLSPNVRIYWQKYLGGL